MHSPSVWARGLTDNSLKTYLNRRVPVVNQGRTFATRNLAESALTIPPLIGISALAAWAGISTALFVMPIVFYIAILTLLRLGIRLSDNDKPRESRVGVLSTYWEAPETDEISSMDGED